MARRSSSWRRRDCTSSVNPRFSSARCTTSVRSSDENGFSMKS